MSNTQKYLIALIPIIILIILAVVFVAPKNENIEFASTFDPNATPTTIASPTGKASEPIPFSWEEYANDEFSFKIQYPSDWHTKEYKRNPKGGIFVAFSPDPLPCDDCSYLNSAFYSVKIYSQQTDPEAYAAFLQWTKAVGRVEGYSGARLNGQPGVFHENTIAAENKGWVYELTLEKDLGEPGAEDSQIFRKALSSFQFTYLIFEE